MRADASINLSELQLPHSVQELQCGKASQPVRTARQSDPLSPETTPLPRHPHGLKTRAANGRRAFTLLELLVALAMIVILATSLYATMQIAFKAKASAETGLEPVRTAELAMEFLRTDLQNTLQPSANTNNTPVLIGSFEGTQQTDDRGGQADDVVFYASGFAAPHADANGDVKELELTVAPDPSTGEHLLIRRVSANLTSQIQPTPDQEVICRGVAGFGLRYWDGSQWLTTWDSTEEDNTIPDAVEVTLSLSRPAGTGQPDRLYKFLRIFPLSCSTAAQDTNVNSGLNLQ